MLIDGFDCHTNLKCGLQMGGALKDDLVKSNDRIVSDIKLALKKGLTSKNC